MAKGRGTAVDTALPRLASVYHFFAWSNNFWMWLLVRQLTTVLVIHGFQPAHASSFSPSRARP